MGNNTNGNKRVIFSHIALYYGDNDFVIRTFDFIAHSEAAQCLISRLFSLRREEPGLQKHYIVPKTQNGCGYCLRTVLTLLCHLPCSYEHDEFVVNDNAVIRDLRAEIERKMNAKYVRCPLVAHKGSRECKGQNTCTCLTLCLLAPSDAGRGLPTQRTAVRKMTCLPLPK